MVAPRTDSVQALSESAGMSLGNADEASLRPLGTAQYISEREQSKQLLRQNRDTFFNLIQNAPFGVYVVDAQFRLWQVSAASRKVFSDIDPLIGRDFEEVMRLLWPDAFASEAVGHFRHTLQTGEPYSAQNTTEQRQNIADVESYDWKIERIILPDGQFGVVCYFYGITERIQAEQELEQLVQARTAELSQVNANLLVELAAKEQLREREERLLTVAENLNEGLVITSMEGEFIHWNRASLNMHGFVSMAECMGQLADISQLLEINTLDGATLPFDQWPMTRALRGERVRNCELRIRRTDTGVERILSYGGTSVRDSIGKQSAFLIVTDITERKRAEEQLRELNETLEQRVLERTQALSESEERQKLATNIAVTANQAKSDFLSTMSHEIRTPLNGLLGMTDLLLAGHLTPQQHQYAELAQISGKTLLALVNDLLDIGKIEAGRLDVEHIPFSMNELLSELTDLHTLSAHEKGLVFLAKKAPNVPNELLGDPGHLRQILNNLLANALKFTQQGKIGLSVERLDDNGHGCLLRFTVHDSGIGIAADMQPRLFTRFTQVNASSTSEYGGSGLGLAIVKQLCEHLGGKVVLASTLGQGSVFSCDLPFAEVAQTVPVPVPVLSQARILMAEDNPINQIVAQAVLEQIGCAQVTVVDNGQEAVNAVLRGGFDLVLMDCRMPVLDGYGATEQIRARGFVLPIIAMTANAASDERDKCLNQGMNDYISKPFNIATLRQTLARWIP